MPNHKIPPRKTSMSGSTQEIAGERELILIADPSIPLTRDSEARGLGAPDLSVLSSTLEMAGATIRPLFGPSEDRVRALSNRRPATTDADAMPSPDLSVYYKVDAPDERLDELAEELRSHPSVRAAYVKPPAVPAVPVKTPEIETYREGRAPGLAGAPAIGVESINDMAPTGLEAPPISPNFNARQGYLGAAPAGIDALYAWTQPGGGGANVRIIDIEGEWRFTHEDLLQNQGGMAGGNAANDVGWRNHGTAVIGVIGADRNAFGVTGICPDANVRGISFFGQGTAAAIRLAADRLGPGDIILIELHRPGPRATGVGQQGFIAIEWWPDDFDAIRYATSRGVIVVEAAGNGAQNLDDPVYDTPSPGFPAGWSNPFRRGARDSGAVLVGAGAPPPGTHGSDHGPDRSRLDFSNYGAAVDAQGWGREVTTTGYGDLQGGSNEDVWYTDRFSGTSSASPIVVGALGCVQGNRRARGATLLTPTTARALLRSTGSPQQDAPGRPATQRIGNRPNLRQAIGGTPALAVPLFRYWNPTVTDHFYSTNWNELGFGRYGWAFEGVQCYVQSQPAPGTAPLHRYWNPAVGDHFYTTNFAELGSGRYGYRYEGVQCHVFTQAAAGRVPLYRYWNVNIRDHFYTTNWNELGYGRYGYRFEGVQCYVKTQAAPVAEPEAPTHEAVTGLGPDIAAWMDSLHRGADGVGGAAPFFAQAMPDLPEIGQIPESFATPNTASMMPTSFGGGQPGEMPGGIDSFAAESTRDSFASNGITTDQGVTININLGRNPS